MPSLLGCDAGAKQKDHDAGVFVGAGGVSAKASDSTPQKREPDWNAPIRCQNDTDCGRLVCGPCTPGEPVSVWHRMVNCTRNPCPGKVSVCQGGICVVAQ